MWRVSHFLAWLWKGGGAVYGFASCTMAEAQGADADARTSACSMGASRVMLDPVVRMVPLHRCSLACGRRNAGTFTRVKCVRCYRMCLYVMLCICVDLDEQKQVFHTDTGARQGLQLAAAATCAPGRETEHLTPACRHPVSSSSCPWLCLQSTLVWWGETL